MQFDYVYLASILCQPEWVALFRCDAQSSESLLDHHFPVIFEQADIAREVLHNEEIGATKMRGVSKNSGGGPVTVTSP